MLDTDLDTFSFAQAYEYINSRAYDDTRQFVREKVKSIIVAARAARLSDSVLHKSDAEKLAELQEKYIRDVGGLFGRVQRAHAFVSRAAPKRLEKKVVEYRCYNLAGDTTRKDSCTVTDFILTEAPLYAYGLTVMADDLALNIGDPDFSIRDSENQNHEAVAVALPDSYRGQISIEYANLMLFLQEPLLPSETPHQITCRSPADRVLLDLLDPAKRCDSVAFACEHASRVDEVYLICQIPRALLPHVQLIDDSSLKSERATWVAGQRMIDQEINDLDLGFPEPGHVRIGWRTTNLVTGNETGFTAKLVSSG